MMTRTDNRIRTAPRGQILLITTLIIMAVVLIIGVSIATVGQDQITLSLVNQNGESAFTAADSCIEEGILRLKVDENYAGDSFDIDGGTCSVAVTNLGGNDRLITGTGTFAQNIRVIQANVTIIFQAPPPARHVLINSWQEVE